MASNPISPKATAGGTAAAATTVLVWIADQAGIDLPVAVAGAFITVVAFLASYITPDPLRDALMAIEERLDINIIDEGADE